MKDWQKVVELIDKLTVPRLVLIFIGTVILFSFLFYFLTLSGNGIVLNYPTGSEPGYLDCLYFSIVTISSLGYGDIRPVGIARFACSIEVVLGLAFFGLLVSRLASRKQDIHLSVIYKDIVRKSLEGFLDSFKLFTEEYRNADNLVRKHLEKRPEDGNEQLKQLLRGLYFQHRGKVNGLRQYLRYCVKNKISFDHSHSRLLLQINKELNKILCIWKQFPEKGREIYLSSVTKNKINKLLIIELGMLKVLYELTKDEELSQECTNAEKHVNEIRMMYNID
jgi:hypothetical protein